MKKNKIILIIFCLLALMAIIIYSFYYKTKEHYTTKEDILSLLDKGLKSSSQVNIFIITKDSLEDEYTKIINEGKYKDLIGFIDLSKYKGDEFEFKYLRENEDCVLGYFLEKNNNINGSTYIRVNKRNGELEDLDNNLLKVTIY